MGSLIGSHGKFPWDSMYLVSHGSRWDIGLHIPSDTRDSHGTKDCRSYTVVPDEVRNAEKANSPQGAKPHTRNKTEKFEDLPSCAWSETTPAPPSASTRLRLSSLPAAAHSCAATL